MANSELLQQLIEGIKEGSVIPYLGPGVLREVTEENSGAAIPADSDSLIYAMNDGKPMAPRLMYEFPRAAMNLELKKGRSFVERFLTQTYGSRHWSISRFHQWLASLNPQYLIDTNRDTQLQLQYADRRYTLVVGLARITGTDYRYKIFEFANNEYRPIDTAQVDTSLPVLFKPMGTPLPEPNYVASDADYVDYITELMGGFAIPSFLKNYRLGKQYLFLGMRMLRDTERMVLSDMIYGADDPAGWVLIPNPTDKERRFCAKKNLEVIDGDWESLLEITGDSMAIAD